MTLQTPLSAETLQKQTLNTGLCILVKWYPHFEMNWVLWNTLHVNAKAQLGLKGLFRLGCCYNADARSSLTVVLPSSSLKSSVDSQRIPITELLITFLS